MPREYIRREEGRLYVNYTHETLKKCLYAVKKGMPKMTASRIYNIPLRTLQNKINGLHCNKIGGQMLFTEEEEHLFVNHILKIAEFGYPITCVDIRRSVAMYLNNKGVVIEKFTDNVPGKEWVRLLIKRHHCILSKVPSLNVKGKRAKLAREDVEMCIDKIRESVDEISSHASSESAQLAANIGKAFLQYFERKLCETSYSRKKLSVPLGKNVHQEDFEDSVDIVLDSEVIDLPLVGVTNSSTTSLPQSAEGPKNLNSLPLTHCSPIDADIPPTDIIIEIDEDVEACISSTTGIVSDSHKCSNQGYVIVKNNYENLDNPKQESQECSSADCIVTKDRASLLRFLQPESQGHVGVENIQNQISGTKSQDCVVEVRCVEDLLPEKESEDCVVEEDYEIPHSVKESQNYVIVEDDENLLSKEESEDYIVVVGNDETSHPETESYIIPDLDSPDYSCGDYMVVKDENLLVLSKPETQDHSSEDYVVVKDELLDGQESQDYVIVRDVETLLSGQVSQNAVIVEDNDNPLCRPKSEDYSVGDYVVVKDNDNSFPGQVLIVLDDGLIVSCMKRGRRAWKWPLEEINMICQFHNILYKKLVIKEKYGEMFLLSKDGYHVIL